MTIPVKIDCACGQRYAFEVDPVHGRVPSPVNCPSCGADGTDAANAVIAQSLKAQPSPGVAAPGPGPLRVALPRDGATAPARIARSGGRPAGASLLPGQTTRMQAQIEARAKMLWGDPPLQVMAYLLSQGFNREEASELVQEFLRERIRTIRMKGIKYVALGVVLLLVPGMLFLGYWLSDYLPTARAIGVVAVIGLFGAGLLIKGIGLLISPKSESGDASEEIDPDSLFD